LGEKRTGIRLGEIESDGDASWGCPLSSLELGYLRACRREGRNAATKREEEPQSIWKPYRSRHFLELTGCRNERRGYTGERCRLSRNKWPRGGRSLPASGFRQHKSIRFQPVPIKDRATRSQNFYLPGGRPGNCFPGGRPSPSGDHGGDASRDARRGDNRLVILPHIQ